MASYGKVCRGLAIQEDRPNVGMARRRRSFSLSAGNGVTTPPKTPAKSRSPRRTPAGASPYLEASCRDCMPRRMPQPCPTTATSAHAVSHGGGGEALGAALPWAVCEAVSGAIWKSAKEVVAAEQAAAVDAGAPSPKRHKLAAAAPAHDLASPACGSDAIFPSVGLSQPSQPTQLSQVDPTEMDAAAAQAHAALRSAWDRLGPKNEDIPVESFRTVCKMQQAAQRYWRDAAVDLGKAASSVARFLEQQRRLYWRRETWRGVNLGGWLLLEPGPSSELFNKYGPASCEWDLMKRMREQLGDEGAERALASHRDRYITEDDIRCIKALGLNAVRIPFGYWVAMGPAAGDPYSGPGLQHLDQALAWCKTHGLQAILDLHGAPGGESGEKPSGHERKDWQWQDWRFDESVAALEVVAARYRGHPAVSGISVCNEPSEKVPTAPLCHFYDRAVRAIREAGMAPDEVAIILPVYRTERLDEVWRLWSREYDGFARHANVAFDLHLYHCFGTWWERQGLASQLRMTKRHRKILRRVPAVVGEWSLALAPQARRCDDGDGQKEEDQALRAFAEAQLEAYSQASHGWFFWTWRDCPLFHQPGWDLRKCLTMRWLSKNQLTDTRSSPKSVGGG